MKEKLNDAIKKFLDNQSQLFLQCPDRFNILASQIPIEVNEAVVENNAHPIFIGLSIMWLLKIYPPISDLDPIVSAMYVCFVTFSAAEADIHNTLDRYVAAGVEVNAESEITNLKDSNCAGMGVIYVMLFVVGRTLAKAIIEEYFK